MAKVKGEVKGVGVGSHAQDQVQGMQSGFDVLGVVDLRDGLAVRARGGRRQQYMPIESVAGETIRSGDATALARHYVERVGLTGLYVADLDAIESGRPPHAEVGKLSSVGVPVWLDAGIASSSDAQRALSSGASRLIVGLETLPSFHVLKAIVEGCGRARVVFSLDLRDGQPIATATELVKQRPEDLAARAADAGVGTMIVLDLARVGSGSGVDLEALTRIRSVTSVPMYAGGGVRSVDDIELLRDIGCDGALVASALLDGQITELDLDLRVRRGYT
jgi:phosphoribosylformimino-5-aminoimidazole carboxamide ribotide isomerase